VNNFYSPIWFNVAGKRKSRNVTSIKFEDGERLKYCSKCDDYHPGDTEFFSIAKSRKVGLSQWCRCCIDENQKLKQYWSNNNEQ